MTSRLVAIVTHDRRAAFNAVRKAYGEPYVIECRDLNPGVHLREPRENETVMFCSVDCLPTAEVRAILMWAKSSNNTVVFLSHDIPAEVYKACWIKIGLPGIPN